MLRTTALALALASSLPAPVAASPSPVDDAAARTGRVLDGVTGRPIPGAELTLDDATVATSDEDGGFTWPGTVTGDLVVILAAGYEPGLVAFDELDGDLVLWPLGTVGEIIEVTDEAPPAAPGAARVDRDELERIPGTGNDLLASLTVLPGVTTTAFPTSFNGVVIRGAAPEDSKILVDGFEVPLLYHSIAFRSILPSQSIASLEYLPGGFDVGYGRASSGIVAVTTRRGDGELGGQAEASVIDGGLLAHGPAGDDGSFLFALRRSTVDLILPSVIPDDAGISLVTVPRYYDAQARLDLPLSDRWQLAVSAIGADDALELYGDDEADPDQRFFQRTRFARLIADARWYRDGWGVNVAASGLAQGVTFEIGRDRYLDVTQWAGTVRGEVSRTRSELAGLQDVIVRGGGELDLTHSELALSLEGEPEPGDPMGTATAFMGTVESPDLAAWSSIAAGLGPRLRLTTGLRVDGFLRGGDVAVQPRGELAATLGARTIARLAAGAYRRPPENQGELLDDTLDPERATQVVLGVEHAPADGVKVQTSIYYTDRSALLTRVDDGFANVGRGTSYGAELLATLRRGAWFGWLSYSRSHSVRVDRPGEEARLFDYDQPSDLNVALSWRHGPWQLGARWSYSSGTPYTPVDGAVYDSDADRYVPVFGGRNTQRVSGHHQLDLRVDRTWRLGRVTLTGFLDVQNVYLNAQTVGYGYNFDYSERYAFEGLPILPSLGLRGEL